MPQFNVVTGQPEYMPWEIQPPMDQRQAAALPKPAMPAPQAPAPTFMDMMKQNGQINPDGYNDLMRKLDVLNNQSRAASNKALAGQESGVSQLEQNLNEIKGMGPAINFRPLMAAFDSLYGTNQAEKSGPQETPEERAQKLFELQNKIQMAKDQLSENRVKASQQDIAHLMGKASLMGQKQDRFEASQIEKSDLEMRNKFNKVLGAANDVGSNFNKLQSAFTPGPDGKVSAYGVQASMSNFARSVGGEKGVLTDTDVYRVLPPDTQQVIAKWENRIKGLGSDAKLEASEVQPLMDALARAKSAEMQKHSMELDRTKKMYENSPGKFTQQVWQTAGKDRYKDAQKELERGFGSSPAPFAGGLMSPEEFLKARRGQ